MIVIKKSQNRLLLCGLMFTLLLLSSYATLVSWLYNQAEAQAKSALLQNNAYQSARKDIESANNAMATYRLTPGNDVLDHFYAAEATLAPKLTALLANSAGMEHGDLQHIAATNAVFIQQAQQLVAAMNMGNVAAAAGIETSNEAIIATMLQTMNDLAESHQREAITQITAVDKVKYEVLYTTPIVFLFGSGLVWGIWRQLQLSQKRLECQQRQEIDQLSHVAFTDNLTKLGNHRAFQEQIRTTFGQALEQAAPLSLAILDIDQFKSLNDGHGHAFGDQVLRKLGDLLVQDGLLHDACAYRLGGDEFGIIMPMTLLDQACTMLETLRQEAAKALFGATLSIGVAALSPSIISAEGLQEQADAALYEAKHHGRNRLIAFDESLATTIYLPSRKADAMQRLLQDQEMTIFFQPIWDVGENRLLAVEALARPDEKYGFAGPQEMFDIAEKMGRAYDLDVLCYRNALLKARQLSLEALLFVNICPISLEQLTMDDDAILATLHASGFSPDRIVIEVTERAVHRLEAVISQTKRLQQLGFGIALDDAGSGNMGLEMLSSLPADYVKIDRSILVKAMTDRAARGVLSGIAAIARETGSLVIAEGIEDFDMFAMVKSVGTTLGQNIAGVRGVQGYLFGKPSNALPQQTPAIFAENEQLAA